MRLKALLKTLFSLVVMGILAGLGSSLFLYALNVLTELRIRNPILLLGLPILGLSFALLQKNIPRHFNQGAKELLKNSRGEESGSFFYLPPIVLSTTLASHFFGASVGRESAAAQIGGGFSSWIPKMLIVSKEHQNSLIVAGLSAGFGAAVGAPIAGIFFGMEVTGGWTLRNIFYTTTVSLISLITTKIVHAPHTQYPITHAEFIFSAKTILAILTLSITSGALIYFFFFIKNFTEQVLKKVPFLFLQSTLIGTLLAICFYYLGYRRYAGLGIEHIQFSLLGIGQAYDPLFKVFFTALSIGGGFKGGEFIPFVFTGTSLGALVGKLFSTGLSLPILGFGLFYGAATRTPIACSIMVGEIFGWNYTLFCFVACIITISLLGKRSVFSD